MLKECVILSGLIINIGPWDYQIRPVQVGEDEEGNPIYEDQTTNPLPVGAVVEQRDFAHDPDRGWYEVGTTAPKTEMELVQEENAQQNLTIIELFEAIIPLIP